MRKLRAGIGMLFGGVLMVVGPQDVAPRQQKPTVVLGTFDSRAVLTAWVRSAAFGSYISSQRVDIEKAIERAKSVGDRSLTAELQAIGPAMQERIHRQGFGTAPIDDILASLADRMPAIAAKAGVDVIVSKWHVVHRGGKAETVDVTDLLVAEFQPDAATLEAIRALVARDPMPLDQLDGHR